MAPARADTSAVVGHHIGHVAEGVADGADIDVLHLGIKVLLGHLEEQGSHHGAVLDIDAGGGDAHRVHPGHVLGSADGWRTMPS